MATAQKTVTDICVEAKAASRQLALLDSATQGPRAERDRRRARRAGRRDPRGQRARHGGRPRDARGRAARPPAARRRSASRRSPTASARSPRSTDPVGEVIREFRLYNGLDAAQGRASRSASSRSSTRRGRTSRSTPPRCASSPATRSCCAARRSAAHSNAVLAGIAARGAREAPAFPRPRSSLVAGGGREELAELATQEGIVDLIIPRGGEGLKAALKAVATVPVIYAAAGQLPRLRRRRAPTSTRPTRSSSTPRSQRPGVCNAAETLLVHSRRRRGVPARACSTRCATAGVELRVDERARALAGVDARRLAARATDEDWDTEYLALMLAVGVVDSRRGGDRARQPHGTGPLGGDRHRLEPAPRRRSSAGRRRLRLRQRLDALHRRRRVRAWAPRSATRPRSCTRAARSACASCARTSTSSTATARCAPDGRPRGARRHPRRDVQPAAPRPPRLRAGGADPARARRRAPDAGRHAAASRVQTR